MKKYLVYGVKANGSVDIYLCFSNSREEAAAYVIRVQGDLVRASAFACDI